METLKLDRSDFYCSLNDFYSNLAKRFNLADNYKMDCREINVAKNIQDAWFEWYRNEYPGQADIDAQVCMLLCLSGPKVNEELADNEIEWTDEFITQEA
jgi:hypothetical protein